MTAIEVSLFFQYNRSPFGMTMNRILFSSSINTDALDLRVHHEYCWTLWYYFCLGHMI